MMVRPTTDSQLHYLVQEEKQDAADGGHHNKNWQDLVRSEGNDFVYIKDLKSEIKG